MHENNVREIMTMENQWQFINSRRCKLIEMLGTVLSKLYYQ
jgi:hypothetical protein